MLKEPARQRGLGVRHASSLPESGRSPGEGNGNPVQCSCPENPMDRGAWPATVPRVARSQTRLKRLHTHALFLLRLSQNLPGPPRPIRGCRTTTCCPKGAKPAPKGGEGRQRDSGSPMSQDRFSTVGHIVLKTDVATALGAQPKALGALPGSDRVAPARASYLSREAGSAESGHG